MHPIFHGDYPEVMREWMGDQLPKFSEEDKKLLANSLDFVGLNHYTSRFISHVSECSEEGFFYKAQEMERIGNNWIEVFSKYPSMMNSTSWLSFLLVNSGMGRRPEDRGEGIIRQCLSLLYLCTSHVPAKTCEFTYFTYMAGSIRVAIFCSLGYPEGFSLHFTKIQNPDICHREWYAALLFHSCMYRDLVFGILIGGLLFMIVHDC